MNKAAGYFGVMLLVSTAPSWAQPVSVVHDQGLLTVQCTNAPLSSVFESIRGQAGVELILEDEVKSTHLTANLTRIPVAMAIQRLLEGTGVSYIVMMDPSDWGRVGKVFVGGSGGAGAGRTARAPRPPSVPEPEPADTEEALGADGEEAFEEATEALDAMDAGIDSSNMAGFDPNMMGNSELETPPENPGEFGAPGEFVNPPGSSPVPEYLPPAQSFPRSSFTPGLPNSSSNRRTQGSMTQPQEQNPATQPPATYPFTDPFGRPIPVPPGMTTPQQQQQQQQKRQQQQKQ
jgi:hypothetical protein